VSWKSGEEMERQDEGLDLSGKDFGAIRKALDKKMYLDPGVKENLLGFFLKPRPGAITGNRPILCLLAPPGMGKRSLVKSLCEALSWRLIHIPVGELRAENGALLGSRRADINATAGRIIHVLKETIPGQTVVLLEDVDRTSLSGAGHSTAGFFEVLEYVQDFAIKNKYLATPIDFSRIMFVATAANLSTIPVGMREQMEILVVPSYAEPDKLRIARDYLLPAIRVSHGMENGCTVSKGAMTTLIRKYTQEAGVRELHAHFKTIFEKVLKNSVETNLRHEIRISTRNIKNYLGPPRYPSYGNGERDEVGVVTVLGKSERGGIPIPLELVLMKGEGKLTLTGNTDRMFQESAMVAIDYVRSHCRQLEIADDFHKQYDIHLHMLSGSSPKYGVSAGLAIVTALVSALTGKPVKRAVGMTGEISLHGKVFGVRDIRDKVLGAHQAGLKTVVMPRENEWDLRTIPVEIRRRMKFILVDAVETALEHALIGDGEV
jgi:ATP-dependent Lon protease